MRMKSGSGAQQFFAFGGGKCGLHERALDGVALANTQDEAICVVYCIPKEAVKLGTCIARWHLKHWQWK
jgi:hypothetical protein